MLINRRRIKIYLKSNEGTLQIMTLYLKFDKFAMVCVCMMRLPYCVPLNYDKLIPYSK